MNRRKSKEIRKAATTLVTKFPEEYKSEKLHVKTVMTPMGHVKRYQVTNGFRKAKKRAREIFESWSD